MGFIHGSIQILGSRVFDAPKKVLNRLGQWEGLCSLLITSRPVDMMVGSRLNGEILTGGRDDFQKNELKPRIRDR